MNRWYCKILLLASMSACSAPTVAAEVVVSNPDAQPRGDKMRDAGTLAAVALNTGDGQLSVDAKTVAGAFTEIAGQAAVVTGKLFALAIDADNDAGTGKSPTFARDVKGIEWLASIEVCALEGAAGAAAKPHCVHGIWARHLAGARASGSLQNQTEPGAAKLPLADEPIAAPGDRVRITIPYAKFGAHSGVTVRVQVLGLQDNGVFGPIGAPVELRLD